MDKSKALKDAKKEYDKIMADEHEKMLIRLREKYWLDYNSMKSASYNKGKKAGLEERNWTTELNNGKDNEKKEIAKKLKAMKMKLETIQDVTGLTREEVEKL